MKQGLIILAVLILGILLLFVIEQMVFTDSYAASMPESCTDTIAEYDTATEYDFYNPWVPDSAEIVERNLSYTALLHALANKTTQLQQQYTQTQDSNRAAVISLAESQLFAALTDSLGVFNHWMGTTWDYNGITTEPLKGGIACGYFVSTTLKQMGFNLNRYKLAQQYSHSIVNSLCEPGSIKVYHKLADVLALLNSKANQLYVVGLDNHVGFLANINGEAWFIHSDYVSMAVQKEKFAESLALSYSNAYVVGNVVGSNPQLIKKWLQGDAIAIVP